MPAIRESLDIAAIRGDFPILSQTMRGKPLVFLDSGASSQRPHAVLKAVERLYNEYYSNVHRGTYEFSQRSTDAYEAARERVRFFLNAPKSQEVTFVSGTTEAINLVARSWGGANLGPGDVVLFSEMEHHSNIVPWQLICEERGAKFQAIPISDKGEILLEEYQRMLQDLSVKLVAVTHVSNVLGTVNPIAEMTRLAHHHGALILVDGAQAVPHMKVDITELGCDFYAFSGHKMFAPSGIGVLWGKEKLLNAMPPYRSGGGMISRVTLEGSTFLDVPERFEAGTPNIAGAVGLGAAIDYLAGIDMEAVTAWENQLLVYGTGILSEIPGLKILGKAEHKASVLSFVVEGIHPHDLGTILDRSGVAIRAGHHCAQPLMKRFGVPATARASLAVYNTREDLDALAEGIRKAQELFG